MTDLQIQKYKQFQDMVENLLVEFLTDSKELDGVFAVAMMSKVFTETSYELLKIGCKDGHKQAKLMLIKLALDATLGTDNVNQSTPEDKQEQP